MSDPAEDPWLSLARSLPGLTRLILDAYENEPIYARFSEATECADMIRCDAYWGHPAKRKPADLPSVSASSSRSILWFDPRREHSSVPTAKSSSRRAQGASRPAGSLPVRHLWRFQAAP
jgi:hypothetical protein